MLFIELLNVYFAQTFVLRIFFYDRFIDLSYFSISWLL